MARRRSRGRRGGAGTLRGRGLAPYGEVARFLADTLFRRDFARGVWIVDLGFFRSLYLRDAYRALERLDGRLIRID